MKDDAPGAEPAITLDDLSLTVGGFALRNFSLSLSAGEIGVILGPNGAGKSVTLETVAGFHRPDAGRVLIGGRDVTSLPPERRRVAFILQNFGLFPHLTVAENIAFARHARGRQQPFPDIAPLLARFRLQAVAHARPATLSPGEKQRTALVRGLVSAPDVFLLDEPFAALDARTTESLREELRQFLHGARIPALFVTHDHLDALTLADTVVVMSRGEIVQAGAPDNVFNRPKTRFVAEFLGTENILSGTVTARRAEQYRIDVGGRQFDVPEADGRLRAGDGVLLCLRADAVDVARAGDRPAMRPGPAVRLSGTIVAMAHVGPLVRVTVDCGILLTAHLLQRTAQERQLRPNEDIVADVDPTAIHLIKED